MLTDTMNRENATESMESAESSGTASSALADATALETLLADENQGVDLSFVRLLHATFRRDFARLVENLRATRTGNGPSGAAIACWYDNLVAQLHHHHTIEDVDLLPILRAKSDDPQSHQPLDIVRRQHEEMDEILARVEEGMRGVRFGAAATEKLLAAVDELVSHLNQHLDDEERDAFPVLEKLMTVEEFEQFEAAVRKKLTLRDAAVTFPWVLDGADDATRKAVLGQLPLPLRLVCRFVWVPAYRRNYALPV
jgi:iron-sulfur cluster repair protein YtfE (RIC family)